MPDPGHPADDMAERRHGLEDPQLPRNADLDHQILCPASALTGPEIVCYAMSWDVTGTPGRRSLAPAGHRCRLAVDL